MNVRPVILCSMLIVLAGCEHSIVKENMPITTRTGEVKDIIIREELSAATVNANPGDEIQWVNRRRGDVRVIFVIPVIGMFTCQRNFGSFLATIKNEYSATLGPNETASACFRDPVEIRYIVRAKSDSPSAEKNLAGTIHVQSPEPVSARASERERKGRRSAHVDQDQMSMR